MIPQKLPPSKRPLVSVELAKRLCSSNFPWQIELVWEDESSTSTTTMVWRGGSNTSVFTVKKSKPNMNRDIWTLGDREEYFDKQSAFRLFEKLLHEGWTYERGTSTSRFLYQLKLKQCHPQTIVYQVRQGYDHHFYAIDPQTRRLFRVGTSKENFILFLLQGIPILNLREQVFDPDQTSDPELFSEFIR